MISPFPVLGEMATSAPVLYANTHHPELKIEFPKWADRHKQIIKRWRGLSVDIKTPFNQKARENRTTLRMKKTQQVSAIISVGWLNISIVPCLRQKEGRIVRIRRDCRVAQNTLIFILPIFGLMT